MENNNYNWYPVYTKSRSEKKVDLELRKKGIKTFLPLKKTERIWSDRKKIIDVALFPSYIFVFITPQEIPNVLNTNGVVRFIYFSGKIATMPLKQMNDLQLLLAIDSNLEIFNYDLTEGTPVKIIAGPFKDIFAEVVTINKTKNLVLQLKNLGYSVQIKTSIAYIEPIN